MLKEYMVSLGYEEEKIDRMRNTDPVIKCGDDYLRLAIENVYKLFIKLGYTKKQIIKMTSERPQIFCYEVNLLEEKFNNLKELLGNEKLVIKVTIDFPTLYSYDIDSVNKKVDDLIKLGYKKEIIIKSIKNYPETLGLSIEDNVKPMIKDLIGIGFSMKDIIKITSKNMSIFGRDIQSIKNTIDKVESFGYTHREVIGMIIKHPAILNYAIERLEKRMIDMNSLISNYNDVLNIMKANPSLFGNDMDTIIDKKIFYDSLGLVNFFVESPKDLVQGISKSYARFRYYQSIGIDIFATKDGYKMLFIGEKKFESRYQIEISELISKYDVDEYMKEVKSKKEHNILLLKV